MARSVIWLGSASRDLESIAEYIAEDSATYASAVVARILREARLLMQFPLLVRIVPEVGHEDIRERIVYSYRLIYRVKGAGVEIMPYCTAQDYLPHNILDRE